jgi:very-short-patch-repair endonuclease
VSRPTALESELALRAVAAEHHQRFTTDQALAAGWNRQRLHRWRRTGRIELIHAGVHQFTGSPPSWEADVLAAVLACGSGAVASHRTAMALHHIAPGRRDRRARVEVSIPAGRDVRPHGVVVHRVALPVDHVTVVDRIPCTTYERTLVDSAAKLGLGQLARGLDQGLVANQITLRSVADIVGSLRAAPGRRRTRVVRVLSSRSSECERSDSAQEIRLLSELAASGLPSPIPQCQVIVDGEEFHLDAAYPEHRIGIEYQGWDPHRTRGAFDADHRRDRLLTLAGWSVLYFTSATTPVELVDHITRLRSASRSP